MEVQHSHSGEGAAGPQHKQGDRQYTVCTVYMNIQIQDLSLEKKRGYCVISYMHRHLAPGLLGSVLFGLPYLNPS